MGLDMSLYGEIHNYGIGDDKPMLDGYPLTKQTVELSYWRKHPNLHGYIVNTFAGGEDECQRIELVDSDLENIIEAIKNDKLPFTEGFFFGRSPQKGESEYEEMKEYDLEVFRKARKWLATHNDKQFRSVVYQSSW
jgi:hypothetical protein